MMQVVMNQTQHDIMESLDKGFQYTTINNKVSLFDDDESQSSFKNIKDASSDEEQMWNLFTFTQIVDMTQHEAITLLEKMGDDGMEAMVKLERPIQIINLLIENQTNNIVFGESFLILMIQKTKCGVLQQRKKEARNEIFFNYQQQDCLKMFQSRTQGMVRHKQNPYHWLIPMMRRKNVGKKLNQKLIWIPPLTMKVASSYGSYWTNFRIFLLRIKESQVVIVLVNTLLTQGFLPCRTTLNRLSFWEELEMKCQINVLVSLGEAKTHLNMHEE